MKEELKSNMERGEDVNRCEDEDEDEDEDDDICVLQLGLQLVTVVGGLV